MQMGSINYCCEMMRNGKKNAVNRWVEEVQWDRGTVMDRHQERERERLANAGRFFRTTGSASGRPMTAAAWRHPRATQGDLPQSHNLTSDDYLFGTQGYNFNTTTQYKSRTNSHALALAKFIKSRHMPLVNSSRK